MPTFIDESGNTGIFGVGGTARFHLAGVWLPSHGEVDAFRAGVRGLRRSLGLKEQYEFKFSGTHVHPERRAAFFDLALTLPFRFAVSVVYKRDPHWNEGDGPAILRCCAGELAALLRPVYLAAEAEGSVALKDPVLVDDNRDPAFLKVIKDHFHALPSGIRSDAKLVGKVRFRSSGVEELLQLADMVCGARAAADSSGRREWYERIKARDVAADS